MKANMNISLWLTAILLAAISFGPAWAQQGAASKTGSATSDETTSSLRKMSSAEKIKDLETRLKAL